jgi:hypothetical protein
MNIKMNIYRNYEEYANSNVKSQDINNNRI